MSILEDINAAIDLMKNAPAPAPCGTTRERPHVYFGEGKVGERATCATCGAGVVVLPNGRAMELGELERNFWKPAPPRFTERDHGKSVFQVQLGYRYGFDMTAQRPPVYFDEVTGFTERDWRSFKRARRRPNLTRSTVRTDFGARLSR